MFTGKKLLPFWHKKVVNTKILLKTLFLEIVSIVPIPLLLTENEKLLHLLCRYYGFSLLYMGLYYLAVLGLE